MTAIAERFGADRELFEQRCRALGGAPIAFADSAFSFALFPRLPVAVLLWLGDDEFGARASFLLDATADQHLRPDGILACLAIVNRSLLATA